MTLKVSPYPIPELKEFLRPFRQQFYRFESLRTLERYATGLLSDVEPRAPADRFRDEDVEPDMREAA